MITGQAREMTTKKFASLADLCAQELEGRIVLVRVDYNVPLSLGRDGRYRVADNTRLLESAETIRTLTARGGRVVLLAHLGQPKLDSPAGDRHAFSLRPIVAPLEHILALDRPLLFIETDFAKLDRDAFAELAAGGVALCENLRFSAGEKAGDIEFAKCLSRLGDFYVLDAFSVAHRPHSSIALLPRYLPAFAGSALERELAQLESFLGAENKNTENKDTESKSLKKPSLALVGGAKISTKLPLLHALLDKFDTLAVGGGIANTLLAAKGFGLGASLLEEKGLTAATDLIERAGGRLVLPVDLVTRPANLEADGVSTVACERLGQDAGVGEEQAAVDIGTASLATLSRLIDSAATIVWNGPFGLFETPPFDKATLALARMLADSRACVVAGGGETLLAIERAGCTATNFQHLSTGGGAFLGWLEGRQLAGLTALEESYGKRAEFGGPAGLEPTRYGDWERGGRAIDF